MVALTVWLLDEADADASVASMQRLHDTGILDVFDAAMLRWPAGSDRPSIAQIPSLAGERALPPSFWTTLCALTFSAHQLGAGMGAAAASLSSEAEALGVDPALARAIREHLRPGMAVGFVYSSGEFARSGQSSDEISRVRGSHPIRLLRSNLTPEQEERIRGIADR